MLSPTSERLRVASRSLPVAIGCAAAAVVGVAGWALLTPGEVLRRLLVQGQFWTLEVQFLVVAAATWREVPVLVRHLNLSRRTWLSAGACALVCFSLTAFTAPRTSRIFFDEQIYQTIGRNLADLRLAQMCNDGTVEYGRLQCWSGEYNKQPYGYPYLLSVGYRLAGVKPWIAYAINNAAAAATVIVVFVLTILLFGEARSGAFAAGVMTIVPMQLLWSNTAASEPTAELTCAAALLTAVYFTRVRSHGALAWMASVTVFAASFRPESLLVVPLVAMTILFLAPDELGEPRVWWSLAIAVLVGWVVVAHAVAVRHEPWGTPGERLSLHFVANNLRTNGWFYLWDERFPALITMLALLGSIARRRARSTWITALYFFAFWSLFLVFYAGSYDYGADVRYSLMTYPPLAVMAGAGLMTATAACARWIGQTRAAGAAIALLAVSLIGHLPLVRATGEEAWGARGDVAFVERAITKLPANSIVLTQLPSLFHVLGINAAQTSVAVNDPARVTNEFFVRYAGGVYLHWNFWCNVADPAQQGYCDKALSQFDHDLIAEEQQRTYRYALYRLRMKRPS